MSVRQASPTIRRAVRVDCPCRPADRTTRVWVAMPRSTPSSVQRCAPACAYPRGRRRSARRASPIRSLRVPPGGSCCRGCWRSSVSPTRRTVRASSGRRRTPRHPRSPDGDRQGVGTTTPSGQGHASRRARRPFAPWRCGSRSGRAPTQCRAAPAAGAGRRRDRARQVAAPIGRGSLRPACRETRRSGAPRRRRGAARRVPAWSDGRRPRPTPRRRGARGVPHA